MKKIKKGLILTLVTTLILSSHVIAGGLDKWETEFNEFGFRDEKLQEVIKNDIQGTKTRSMASWENFKSENNVSLDKEWTVKFSKEFEYSSIAAISIVKDSEFISVKTTKISEDKLTVLPTKSYSANTKYSLRIVLENGKKYKKDFTTTVDQVNGDNEPNNTFIEASTIDANEEIVGKITKNDVDYYKVKVPKFGTLKIDLLSLKQEGLDLSLYGEDYDKGTMDSYRDKSKGSVSEGVMPGTYYIRVSGYKSSTESDYELKVNYSPSEHTDDNAGSSFINAKEIKVNETFTGHIGYRSANRFGNYKDYYKIEIPKEGTIDIALTSFNQRDLDLYFYGEDHTKGSMESLIMKKEGRTSLGLSPGIYYIYIKEHRDTSYSPYELDVKYKPSQYENDNGGNSFASAGKINLNEKFTGHIGYRSANRFGNYNDYFKIDVPKSGTIKLDLRSLYDRDMDLYLYDENYGDGSLSSIIMKKQGVVTRNIEKGTYYIKIKEHRDNAYSPYELNVEFN